MSLQTLKRFVNHHKEAKDIKETNIILQGLPQDIYNLVNHHKEAKDIWDRVKLLIEGYEISLQERESKLYDEFDTFTSVLGETIHSYYLSKFVTDLKLAKHLHNTNFDHLYGYLRQHEAHVNEVRQTRKRYPDALALVATTSNSSPSYNNQSQLAVPSFQPSDDPIASLNKAMAFISASFTSQYPPTNNKLRTSSNLRNQETIQDGRVTVQTIQGRQAQSCLTKAIHCYNCQKEGHTARQCTKPKRHRNLAWFKEKAMLAEALKSGVILDEEHMAFLADNGDTVTTGQESQGIPTPAIFQTNDMDAFDSDCDEAPYVSVVLMAKLSAYDLDVLSDVPTHNTYLDNQVIDQSVQEM
ncbi:retrovirus-related pol polyprotein from transposon TNT 1-94 [Tanacetum coccineum]